jgi:hypothetical protein
VLSSHLMRNLLSGFSSIKYCFMIFLNRIVHSGMYVPQIELNSMHLYRRVQQESSDGAERNRFLVNYVDFAFDDFGDRQTHVYPGLSTVWGSLARSKVSMDFYSLFGAINYQIYSTRSLIF